jgi:Ser/Thr protein kinase RdoA (MazF antagonist)
MQVFAYQPGVTLDRIGEEWESWVPAVLAQLQALQQAGEACRHSLGRRRDRQRSLLVKLLPTAFLQELRGGCRFRELAFLSQLTRTVARLPRVLSHGDLHRGNVLIDAEQDRIALIDWDRWGYLPVGFDAALLLRGVTAEQAERMAGGDRKQRLGVLAFTYLFQCQDVPGFSGSAGALAVQRRIRELCQPDPEDRGP